MLFLDAAVESSGGGAAGGLVPLVFFALIIASIWKVFTKAGEPGWAALVPFYNLMVLLKIAGKPSWWIVLFLIPGVNFVGAILLLTAIAQRFGKSTGFGLGLVFASPIFWPMLAFGDAKFQVARAA